MSWEKLSNHAANSSPGRAVTGHLPIFQPLNWEEPLKKARMVFPKTPVSEATKTWVVREMVSSWIRVKSDFSVTGDTHSCRAVATSKVSRRLCNPFPQAETTPVCGNHGLRAASVTQRTCWVSWHEGSNPHLSQCPVLIPASDVLILNHRQEDGSAPLWPVMQILQ